MIFRGSADIEFGGVMSTHVVEGQAPNVISHSERVGVAPFDDEHVRLAELLQAATLAAHDDVDPQVLREELSAIFAYALMHFSEEEYVMKVAKYPGLAIHRLEHGKIMERLQRQLTEYDSEPKRVALDIVDILELWLHDHIVRFDVDYGRFLRHEL
jgi:hemerythrin-like metal-binding protein